MPERSVLPATSGFDVLLANVRRALVENRLIRSRSTTLESRWKCTRSHTMALFEASVRRRRQWSSTTTTDS